MDISTISLILQLIVLAMLIYGYLRFRASDIKGHGFVLCAATVVHIGSILLRMIPAIYSDPQFISITLDLLSLIHWSHVALGLIPPTLGVYLSLRWIIHRTDTRYCTGKWIMRITFITWIISLLFGIVMYLSP
jgi:uncharacterized membrane protein YozB (DUF420 family)